MAAPIALQRPQQEYIGPAEITQRNQTLRKVAIFGIALGLGLLFSYLWFGLGIITISSLAYRYIATIDSSHKLIDAVTTNDRPLVKRFLFLGANPNIHPNNSALMNAAMHGYCNIMQDLLGAGANPNIRNLHNQTPLSEAVCNNQDGSVAILMEAGADPTIRTENINPAGTPLDYALREQELFRLEGGLDHILLTDKRTRMQRIAAADSIVNMLQNQS